MQRLSRRSSCSSICLMWRCCHGALWSWGSTLWTLQLPLVVGMDHVHQGPEHGGRMGAHKAIAPPLTQASPPPPVTLFQPMMPAETHPFSTACQPHTAGVRVQRRVNHPLLGPAVPPQPQTSVPRPRLMGWALALTRGK